MPTIIRRSAETGDPRLVRQPFATPGPQPLHRFSSLSLQGEHDTYVRSIPNIGSGAATIPALASVGTISTPILKVRENGIPVVRMNMSEGANDTLFANIASPEKWKTIILIGRILILPKYTGATTMSQFGRLVGGGNTNTANYAMLITGEARSNPGYLVAGNGDQMFSNSIKRVVPNIDFNFFSVVLDDAASRVQVDEDVKVGTTVTPTWTPSLRIGGGGESDWAFEFCEIELHATALTRAQLDEKRAHYRALYQI